MPPTTDLLSTAILGPWVKATGTAARRQHVYLTLAHWYEGAKFMPHQPEMREALLFCPSIKEARKYARLRQAHWRPDWTVRRETALIAGLGLLALQRPELGLRTCEIAAIEAGLRPLALPARFVESVLLKFDAWRNAPRFATFGAATAPEAVVGAKLFKLVLPLPTWTLVTPCHRGAAWRVHDWALTHYVPVQYVGTPTDRANRAVAGQIVNSCDHVIVFEQRGNRMFDHVLQLAKQAKKMISLELYTGQARSGGQLDGLSSAP